LFKAFNLELASESAETELATAFSAVKAKIEPLMIAKDYQGALTELSALKQPIDNFFDNVMVMADDEQVKTNRLTLLNEIRNSFFAIADISLLQ
jgi:glycyl-tRNA synthetase beta chain